MVLQTHTGTRKNVEKILGGLSDDVSIIPGHGPLANKKDFERFHQMLKETTDEIQSKMKKGASLKDIQAEGPDPKWESWGAGFVNANRWISTVYRSLSN